MTVNETFHTTVTLLSRPPDYASLPTRRMEKCRTHARSGPCLVRSAWASWDRAFFRDHRCSRHDSLSISTALHGIGRPILARSRTLRNFRSDIDHSLLPAPLLPGDLAPSFDLKDVRSGGRASLSDYRGRPVVLVFGSLRCEILRSQFDRLNELRAAYANRVGFLFIVIRGAGRPETDAPAPEALAPDASHAADLQSVRDELDRFHLTTLVDEHDVTARAYNASPRRLLIVDAAGRIAFDGARGAIGGSNDWDLQAVRAHLDSLLGYTR